MEVQGLPHVNGPGSRQHTAQHGGDQRAAPAPVGDHRIYGEPLDILLTQRPGDLGVIADLELVERLVLKDLRGTFVDERSGSGQLATTPALSGLPLFLVHIEAGSIRQRD